MIKLSLEMFLELRDKGLIDSNMNLYFKGEILGKVLVGA